MSFLDSVLTSLQTGKPAPLPVSQPPSPPSIPAKGNDRNPGSAPRQTSDMKASTNGGIKRKAEEQLPRISRPAGPASTKPSAARAPTTSTTAKGAVKPTPASNLKGAPSKPGVKPVQKTSANVTSTTTKKVVPTKPVPSTQAAVPAKSNPKGSFADIMAQAKALQEKAPSKVGLVRNAKTEVKYSRAEWKHMLAESKRRARAEKAGKVFKPSPPPGERARAKLTPPKDASRKTTPEVPTYRGTAKKATVTPEPPAYRGTAGLPGRNGGNDRRQHGKRRMDEYLGTDEEDEGGDYGGYEDYYSDASSDMEAGFDDVEKEDRRALNNARREDEEEARLELEAKKEKLARQKRLAALASRKR